MKRGDGVRLIDGSLGIVLYVKKGFINVLCEDMNVYPIRYEKLVETGKNYDFDMLWDAIRE